MKKLKDDKFIELVARRNKFYERHKLAIPEDVSKMQSAIDRAVSKRGHKIYRKNRVRVNKFIDRLFVKYNLAQTKSENFWRLWAVCRLIGPSDAVISKSKRKQ